MKYTAEQLLTMAGKFEKISSDLIKNASAERFADIFRDYDTAPLMIDDLIEGLKIATEKGYENGKGFSKEAYDLLLQQIALISAALEPIKPELAALDEKIYEAV